MNKETRFMVTITTSDKITSDEDKNEMAQNIADALVSQCKTAGLAPEDSDVYTEIIHVNEWYSDTEVIEHVL